MTGAGVSAMLRWFQGKNTDENTELEWADWQYGSLGKQIFELVGMREMRKDS